MKLQVYILSSLILSFFTLKAQLPFYYHLKEVKGTVYDKYDKPIDVKFLSRNKLSITNCNDHNLESFLRHMTLTKFGRKQLKHLLTTKAQVRIVISEKVGITHHEGKYRLCTGVTGPGKENYHNWITDYDDGIVHKKNEIKIFKGCLKLDSIYSRLITSEQVFLFELDSGDVISKFSMDTIKIESLNRPELMYKNIRELYHLCGIHEITHTTSENIEMQKSEFEDYEGHAMELELKAYRKRKKINKKKIKKPLHNKS